MNIINLNNFEISGKIVKENFSLESIIKRYSLTSNRIKTAERILKNCHDDESVYVSVFSELYESYRSLCEIMLALCGFRAKDGRGHQEAALNTMLLTLDDDTLKPECLRLNKLGRKRNPMEYAGMFDISIVQMEQMLIDASTVLARVGSEIESKKPGDKLDLKI